jgi:NADPH2:quinone reductase
MKAVALSEFGGPEVLHVVELADPEPAPGEVRIRVHAAAVNPTDAVLRSGARADRLGGVPPPYVPGMDAAGTIDRIGSGVVTELAVGDQVMAIVVPSGSHGAYAELVAVPAESVARVPAGSSDAEAATLPMNGLTARQALDVLTLAPGDALAVTGAAGAVGGYVVQLAKADGLRVVADAAPKDRALLQALGADMIVDRGDDFAARVREVVPEGVDGLVDAALLGDLVVPALRDGGSIVTLRGYVGEPVRAIGWHPVFVRDYARQQAKLDRLREQAEDAQLALRVARTFPAEEAAEAHRLLEAGGLRGRLVLLF